MKNKIQFLAKWTLKNLSSVLFVCAILMLMFSIFKVDRTSSVASAARNVEDRIHKLERKLDKCAEGLLSEPADEWAGRTHLPGDMVMYKYVDDTLHSWINSFPLLNDELWSVQYSRLSRTQTFFLPMLAEIGEDPCYMNLGSQWYVIKSYRKDNVRLVGGIMVKSVETAGLPLPGGVNSNLGLSSHFNVEPLAMADGVAVHSSEGVPLFAVTYRRTEVADKVHNHSSMQWTTMILFLLSFFTYFVREKTKTSFWMFVLALGFSVLLSVMWTASAKSVLSVFSPLIYADSALYTSLGSMLVSNLYIFLFFLAVFIIRKRLMFWYQKSDRTMKIIYMSGVVLCIAALLVYIHISFKSVVFNSNIVLELFRLDELTRYTFYVYGSFAMLFMVVLLCLQLLAPVFSKWHFTIYNVRFLIKYSLAVAMYFLLAIVVYGSKREEDTVKVWTNKLSVERDLSTEMVLRRVEDAIAGDRIIQTLILTPEGGRLIADRLAENYLSRLSVGYDITVTSCGMDDLVAPRRNMRPVNCIAYYNAMLRYGTLLYEGSYFYYIKDNAGKTRYLGCFAYDDGNGGKTNLYVEIESKMLKEKRGYSDLFPENIGEAHNIPPAYSYAKYLSGSLVYYRGDYNFPVSVTAEYMKDFPIGFSKKLISDNLVFVNKISPTDVIFITRHKRSFLPYIIAYSYLVLLTLGFMLIPMLWKPRKNLNTMRSRSFRKKFMALLIGTITVTVVLLTISTVLFIYNRNVNMRNDSMADKLQSVHSMLQDVCRNVNTLDELMTTDIKTAMDNIASYTHTDINLYDTQGHLRLSTRNEMYYMAFAGVKIDQEAFHKIVYANRKSFFNKETVGNKSYYTTYAPIINKDGKLIAILNVPYFEQTADFRREIISTSAAIINLFILLVGAVMAICAAITASLFRPLTNLYEKMERTDIFNSSERITYENNDEIAYIVRAYNKMLDNLDDSTKKLALSEREQAWREMARQIAHEIKNPLTPMRLSIQHLLRMKQNGDVDLEEKMERICKSLLEQIDVLADTATEFSSFAKFNVEENVEVNMVPAIKEQIVLFDSYEGIDIDFRVAGELVGEQYVVMAPKSQLMRVFVNLITNAVQALPGKGHIIVTISKFTADAESDMGIAGKTYVRVDVEDSGQGVSEQNLSKLFTPKFTTKSSGTGLGLAICRNIVDSVGGSIKYYTSEEFGGADFRVIIPEYNPTCS